VGKEAGEDQQLKKAKKPKPSSGPCDSMAVCPDWSEPVLGMKTRITLKIYR
jgi:hypothetical protein